MMQARQSKRVVTFWLSKTCLARVVFPRPPIPTTEITVRSGAPSNNQRNNSSLGPSNPTTSVSSMKREDNRGSGHLPSFVPVVLLLLLPCSYAIRRRGLKVLMRLAILQTKAPHPGGLALCITQRYSSMTSSMRNDASLSCFTQVLIPSLVSASSAALLSASLRTV